MFYLDYVSLIFTIGFIELALSGRVLEPMSKAKGSLPDMYPWLVSGH